MDGARAGRLMTPVYARERLARHCLIAGPAIVEERESTTVIGPGATASVDRFHNLIIEMP